MTASLLVLAMGLGNCQLTPEELELAKALISDKHHIQKPLNCDQDLTWIARARAAMVAQRGKLSHMITSSLGVNDFVRLAGYPLPDNFPSKTVNNLEVLAGGMENGRDAWNALTQSVGHANLLLREDPSYQEFDRFGVGHFYKWFSPYVDYWVIIYATRKAPSPQPHKKTSD
ncbi:hypothetical protein PVT67_13605 [Gallaecimonas kandeliae]|uniref:CAP domain-containing protein n=1 Tax=Gallaecimonas kandeliae TaxID=3029055 RepID=UPI002649832F|nr:hypothetical protein [Gallaecimonas kandeliae]WKE64694.1 hypothetical protein PVT67_13605 [Gallaecimonas kandeliae]